MNTRKWAPRLAAGMLAAAIVTGVSLTTGAFDLDRLQATGVKATASQTSLTQAENYAYTVADIVNEQRAAAGLSSLTMDKDLTEAAMLRAQEITQVFSHTRPDGSAWNTVSGKTNGENIAYGQRTPEEVMTAWMNSSGHRANILGANYKSIGVGCVLVKGTYYWVQEFGMGTATKIDSPAESQTDESSNSPAETTVNDSETAPEEETSQPDQTTAPDDSATKPSDTDSSSDAENEDTSTGTDEPDTTVSEPDSSTDSTCNTGVVGICIGSGCTQSGCSNGSICIDGATCPQSNCTTGSVCAGNDVLNALGGNGNLAAIIPGNSSDSQNCNLNSDTLKSVLGAFSESGACDGLQIPSFATIGSLNTDCANNK